jgi:nicotinate-nucleotide pyrophosphorylase (carboxylating)
MVTAHEPPAIDWDSPEVTNCIAAALAEDIGAGDLTADAIVPAEAQAAAKIIARQALIVAGMPLAERVFKARSQRIKFETVCADGQQAARDDVLARISGPARAILTAERTALNFLAHLSGIATLTRHYADATAGTNAKIRDTRKTTPLLRALEKYAVRAGGGQNHRFGLFDAILIKENHIAVAGSVAEALHRARAAAAKVSGETSAAVGPELTAYESFRPPAGAGAARLVVIQVEVRNEAELRAALAAQSDSMLLDNMPPVEAGRLIALARAANPNCVIEVSGGVNLSNVRAYAEAGADYISIGALTHSAPAADLSLLVDSSGVE